MSRVDILLLKMKQCFILFFPILITSGQTSNFENVNKLCRISPVCQSQGCVETSVFKAVEISSSLWNSSLYTSQANVPTILHCSNLCSKESCSVLKYLKDVSQCQYANVIIVTYMKIHLSYALKI